MSTQSEPEKSQPEKSEKPSNKIYYCEMCKIACMSAMTLQTHFAGMRHKKREKALKIKRAPVVYEESQFVNKPLPKVIRCLKDYMKDPNRDEPLIGLEYVVEIRFQGRRLPCYECQLCQFNTEIVPMIEHLTGQRHRKAYLNKHCPDRGKRTPNETKEDKATFLRRVAGEIEKEEGLKMYKSEGYERPSVPSLSDQRRIKWTGICYKPENDPVQRKKASEYMDFFEITSDTEAAEVIRVALSLSEALKAFCEKKAVLNHIKSLPRLVPPGHRRARQQKPSIPQETSNDNPEMKMWETASESSGEGQELHHSDNRPGLGHRLGPQCHPPVLSSGKEPGEEWTSGHMSNGLAQLQCLLGQASSALRTYQNREKTSSYTRSSNDLETGSVLRKSLPPQSGYSATGINERMKRLSQSAAVDFQPDPVREKSLRSPSSQSSYPTRYPQGSSTQKHDNRMAERGKRSWDSIRDSYSAAREYPAKRSSQDFPSWHNGGNSNQTPVSLPAERNLGWPQTSGYQQPNRQADGRGYQPPFSGGHLYSDYQHQNPELNNTMGQSPAGLSSDIMSQLRGKDPATLTRMLQELVPHYPDLQKVDIYALAHALSRIS